MSEKLGSGLWFGLTPRDRAACTLPLFYAAGLKTTLFVPLLLGASVGFPPAGRAFEIGEWSRRSAAAARCPFPSRVGWWQAGPARE
jgi:hypothetical protein